MKSVDEKQVSGRYLLLENVASIKSRVDTGGVRKTHDVQWW
jgi:hypothetical protein